MFDGQSGLRSHGLGFEVGACLSGPWKSGDAVHAPPAPRRDRHPDPARSQDGLSSFEGAEGGPEDEGNPLQQARLVVIINETLMFPKLLGERLIIGRTLIIHFSALVTAKEDHGNICINRRFILMHGFLLQPCFCAPFVKSKRSFMNDLSNFS